MVSVDETRRGHLTWKFHFGQFQLGAGDPFFGLIDEIFQKLKNFQRNLTLVLFIFQIG